MGSPAQPRKIRLSTTPSNEALAELRLGDVVYLDGLLYTAREGVYKRALEEQANIPMELPAESAANFHCSPAAAIRSDGTYDLGAVTATASFRFSKWIGEWMAKSGAKLIIGKGGMSSKDYKEHFVPNGAIFMVESDLAGNSLFERENAKISANLEKVYEGTRPATLKRFGETDDRSDELI